MGVSFLQILEEHAKRYPLMQPQDFGKLAYQSEFGPRHLIQDKRQAVSALVEEWGALMEYKAARKPEPVSGSLCRFPLSACASQDEAFLLAMMFVSTAGDQRGSREGLTEKIEQLAQLEVSGMREWLAQWRREGCGPVHHSKIYRERYQPHYRLVQREYADYFSVLLAIYDIWKSGKPAVIAIDGRCGSGKTFLAGLAEKLFACKVCHMDDFYMPVGQRPKDWEQTVGGNMDLERFYAQVLHPLRTGGQAVYRPYHCGEDRMGEAVRLLPGGLTVVEGSYAHHPFLKPDYDLTIFLTCGKEQQKRRLMAREGDYFAVFQRQWIPMEERYLQSYAIEETSALVFDTSTMNMNELPPCLV